MNNEIKEILDDLIFTTTLENVSIKLNKDKLIQLKDYITNLQQKIKHYEETTTFGDYVKEVNLLVDYKARIDKAIEITKDLKQFVYDELVDFNVSGATETHCKIKNLLNILEGKDE